MTTQTIDHHGTAETIAADKNGNFEQKLLNQAEWGQPEAKPNGYSLSKDTLNFGENGKIGEKLDATAASGAPSAFAISADTTTRLELTQVSCFAAGTRILTLHGEVAVEDLRAGDLVVTVSGKGSPIKPVAWVGCRDVEIASHPRADLVRPVIIRAGAFDQTMPRRDLVVSPDHALLVDGVLISAGKLINGASIVQDFAASKVRYFHVELDQHDVLLAEGMPAESFLDTGDRDQFANASDVVVLHANFGAKRMQTDLCMPFMESGPAIAAIRRRLIARIESQGFSVGQDPELVLLVNGRALPPSVANGLQYCFDLHERPRELRIISRVFTPSGVSAEYEDCRRLGVCLAQITVTPASGLAEEIAVDDARLNGGFHPTESAGTQLWRWTDGDAQLPPSLFGTGNVRLALRLAWPGKYWTQGEPAGQAYRIAV